MSDFIKEENLNLISLVFGLRLSTPAREINQNDVREFFRMIQKRFNAKFNTMSDRALPTGEWLIGHQDGFRNVIFSKNSLQYQENRDFSPQNFSRFSEVAYEFYTNIIGVQAEDIFLAGKIATYEIKEIVDIEKILQDRLNLFKGHTLSGANMFITLLEGGYNIHITVAIPSEESNPDAPSTVSIDINNTRQPSGVTLEVLRRNIIHADTYNKRSLATLLNAGLGGE